MNLVWFRRDLRVLDNPSLYHACKGGEPVVGVYIAYPKTWETHQMSTCQQLWIRKNLDKLRDNLHSLNIPLLILSESYYSNSDAVLIKLVEKHKIKAVYYNCEYEYDERIRDNKVNKALKKEGAEVFTFDEQCLVKPDSVLNGQGNAYTVFTPYKNNVLKGIMAGRLLRDFFPKPRKLKRKYLIKEPDYFNSPNTNQNIDWLNPGELNAKKTLTNFLENDIDSYHLERDFPWLDATSHLSPYLSIGVISTRFCLEKLLERTINNALNEVLDKSGPNTWLSELIWRDFYKMICFHFPRVSRAQPFKLNTLQLKWSNNQEHFNAWADGRTGVPIIDSAMRQLNKSGWMHNRLRMVTAMYFAKNLWLDWREGEAYFASRLVDWDFSANNGGWQWCASTGNDSAPYFRVFNPILQSQRFDPQGNFIKKFCPELSEFSAKSIHMPPLSLKDKHSYPQPIVDLKTSRLAAIEAFKTI